MIWQVLDVNSIWVKEFTSALSQLTPTLGWMAEMSRRGLFHRVLKGLGEELRENPPMKVRRYPLQRGYSKAPISWMTRLGPVQASRMALVTDDPEHSPLICSTTYYAPVAEKWPGPVIYYLTDMMRG